MQCTTVCVCRLDTINVTSTGILNSPTFSRFFQAHAIIFHHTQHRRGDKEANPGAV